ncbi:MAG: branched-chain amino acid ABC transporter permease [Elusimicrobiota bacterium]
MELFIQQLINGLVLGSIYALIALGYTMVYGILLMINFAHSEIFMTGAYAGAFTVIGLQCTAWGKDLHFSGLAFIFVITFLITGVFGVLMEKIAYRPLRSAPRLSPLISAIGVSIVLQNLAMVVFGPQSLIFPKLTFLENKFIRIGPAINLSALQIIILSISILLMLTLRFYIDKTRLGRAMRATAGDRQTAELMGVNTNLIIGLTFFIGAGLGGAAGLLNGMYYGSIKYNMGFIPGIKAFTAAVIGGIGSITGAMLGGFILGIVEALASGYISSQYKDVFAFIILILVLIFKPSGILGNHTVEKV